MSQTAIEVDGLRRRYGDREALAGVSFDVRRGELFALLGPNGGGKSTLFRILATILPPSAGTARVLGFDVRTQSNEVRRHLGVVFQHASVDGKLTVEYAECLGACEYAPCMLANKTLHKNLTPEAADRFVEDVRRSA